ncbi:TrbC/VirB2 family protein [Candidatus Deianiraea vastatrix]|nr:TrbC/VirB2 family protein [Candidatus Deianiraea vastatrix]
MFTTSAKSAISELTSDERSQNVKDARLAETNDIARVLCNIVNQVKFITGPLFGIVIAVAGIGVIQGKVQPYLIIWITIAGFIIYGAAVVVEFLSMGKIKDGCSCYTKVPKITFIDANGVKQTVMQDLKLDKNCNSTDANIPVN